MMFRYEMKKVFAKAGTKIAVIVLLAILGVTCGFAMDVSYVNENGEAENGYAAVRQLREKQKEWSGILDEEKLQKVIEENQRISATPQAKSKDYKENNIAFSWRQGISEIRELLNASFMDEFRSYDYYKADTLMASDASAFYENRTVLLKEWLSNEAKHQFSDVEKQYLVQKYEALKIPLLYDYIGGWTQLFEYVSTVIIITTLVLGYLVAGIFSSEFGWKSDAIFFTTVHGRNKAVVAKIKAGISIVTMIYWPVILLYSGIVLLYLGADGAVCPVQADMVGWKCFYNIQVWQKYLLTVVGGYIGCLFISFLTMLVSAKTKSAVVAVMLPFILIFIPSFLGNIESPVINKVLGLLPDRLLQISTALGYFDLYKVGGKVIGAIPILLVLYSVLTILHVPIIYQEYQHKQIN